MCIYKRVVLIFLIHSSSIYDIIICICHSEILVEYVESKFIDVAYVIPKYLWYMPKLIQVDCSIDMVICVKISYEDNWMKFKMKNTETQRNYWWWEQTKQGEICVWECILCNKCPTKAFVVEWGHICWMKRVMVLVVVRKQPYHRKGYVWKGT